MHRGTSKVSCNHLLQISKNQEERGNGSYLLSKHEGNHVSKMHTLTARAPPGIDVELFPLFIKVENSLEISMGKEHSSS